MDLNGDSTWAVCITSDDSLNFAMFVGCSYGFISKDAYIGRVPLWPYKKLKVAEKHIKDLSLLSEQWNRWWTELVNHRALRVSRGETNPVSPLFNPPDFSNLVLDELKDYIRQAWPLFQEWWGMPAGGSLALAYWESTVDVLKHVQKFEMMTGKKAKPFRLHIDLVYTGITEVLEISTEHMIISPDPVILMDKKWWVNKLEQIG